MHFCRAPAAPAGNHTLKPMKVTLCTCARMRVALSSAPVPSCQGLELPPQPEARALTHTCACALLRFLCGRSERFCCHTVAGPGVGGRRSLSMWALRQLCPPPRPSTPKSYPPCADLCCEGGLAPVRDQIQDVWVWLWGKRQNRRPDVILSIFCVISPQ